MRPNRLQGAALLLVLLVSALVAYRSVGDLEFLAQDDPTVVVRNPRVAGGLTLQNARWSLAGFDTVNWYPVTWLSHQATVQIFGMSAGAHHRVNLLFHLAGTALLALALWRMTGAAWRSAAVAGLFALHPLHVESVAWVTERSDVAAGALWGATLLAWTGYARRPGAWRYAGAAALFALALAAKATVVTLPCLLLVLDFWPLGRSGCARGGAAAPGAAGWGRLVAEKLPLLALSAAASAATVVAALGTIQIVSEVLL
jgi:hypothetical protein